MTSSYVKVCTLSVEATGIFAGRMLMFTAPAAAAVDIFNYV